MIFRLRTIDDLSKAMVKKLTQGMAEQNKLMAAAKTDEERDIIVGFPLNSIFSVQKLTHVLLLRLCMYHSLYLF